VEYNDCSLVPPVITGNAKINCALPNNFVLEVNGDVWFNNTANLDVRELVVNGNAVFEGDVIVSSGESALVNGNTYFGGGVFLSGGSVFTLQGTPLGTTCDEATFLTSTASCVKQSFTNGSDGEAFSYFALGSEGIATNGGTLTLNKVSVFMEGDTTDSGTAGPRLNLAGGANISWFPPTTGPFEHLSLWSDKVTDGSNASRHEIAGGGSIDIDGIFFTPVGHMHLTGNSNVVPQNAQFWSRVLTQSGGGVFRLVPDGRFIMVPITRGSALIR